MSALGFFGQTICAIGVFDGLHLGHQCLLEQAKRQAVAEGLPLMVVTFNQDPDEVLFPGKAAYKLLSDDERLTRLSLSDYGGARLVKSKATEVAPSGNKRIVLALPFDEQLAALTPEDFLDHVLAEHCIPRGIHVGADFRFGYKASGNVGTLEEWASAHDAAAFGHRLLDDGGKPISATRIRGSLATGNLEEANRLLTRPHHVFGQVIRGRGFGQTVGFPTANISLSEQVIQPADGVYAGFFEVAGELWPTAVAVGVPLTFEGVDATIEAYVLDYEGDLYDLEVTIYFIERLRPMMAFGSISELTAQISRDVKRTRQITDAARGMLD